MTRDEFMQDIWSYYVMLESDFVKTTKYIELCQANGSTFSKEYYKQYQAICSEIEMMFKKICGYDDPEERHYISEYAKIILKKYPDIISWKIDVFYSDIILFPFGYWDKAKASQSLFWWNSYNNVKHNRSLKIEEANMKNVLNALGALYLLENYYLKEINAYPDFPSSKSSLFNIRGWKYNANRASDCII